MTKSIIFFWTMLLVLPFINSLYNSEPVSTGIYDPVGKYNDVYFSYESQFLSWDGEIQEIRDFINSTIEKERIPLLTIEPWQNSEDPWGKDILINTVNGEYDIKIDSICSALSESESRVLVRWGHEMELKNNRYPWSNKDTNDYINAYNYFSKRCRETAPFVQFIWSPAGDENSELYWPGNEYVDYIGLSVYSFEEWNKKYLGYDQSFEQVFAPKYNRLKQFNKPIVIAEMGVTGDDSKKVMWIKEMTKVVKKYPLLKMIIYFNSQDVDGVWGYDIPTPDWRIPQEGIDSFTINNKLPY